MGTGIEYERASQTHMESLRESAIVVHTFEFSTWRHLQKDQRVETSYIGIPCLRQISRKTPMFLLLLPADLQMKTKPRHSQLRYF